MCLLPNLKECITDTRTHLTVQAIFQVTNKILVLSKRSGRPTFRRLRHRWGETIHVVATITVITEEQLVLENARWKRKGGGE